MEYTESLSRQRLRQQCQWRFALGHHPAFEVAAGSNCAWGIDEYEFAGESDGRRGAGHAVGVAGRRFSDSRRCRNRPRRDDRSDQKEICGPWADVMRYYSPQTLEPVFTPTAFLMRHDPICIGNWTGHDTYGVLGAASYVYGVLKERYPRVLAVNQVCPYTYVIQFKPRVPGESTRLAMMALGGFAGPNQNVILVDDDIDPFDLSMVYVCDQHADRCGFRPGADRPRPSSQSTGSVDGKVFARRWFDHRRHCQPVGKPFPDIGKPPPTTRWRVFAWKILSARQSWEKSRDKNLTAENAKDAKDA